MATYCRIANCTIGAHAIAELDETSEKGPLEKVVVGEAKRDPRCAPSMEETPNQSDMSVWETGLVNCMVRCQFRRKEG